MSTIISPFSRPMYIMAKPIGAACNLRCDYCYYLDKGKMHIGAKRMMEDRLLERFIEEYIKAQTTDEVLFTWHGGEPLLCGLDFFKKVMRMQQRHACGHKIDNCLQTNGTLITPGMAQFFHDNGWLIGVSIDGPEFLHNAYRQSANGIHSFRDVMKGIDILNSYNVEWNAMTTVNNINAEHPDEVYSFLKRLGTRFIQFSPVVDATTLGTTTPYSVSPEQWGNFLCTVFDDWVKTDVGEVFVQLFDATLANWAGVAPGVCSMARFCGQAGVLEHNGDVYCCDHFVYPEYRLGNIMKQSLVSMMYSARQQHFGNDKYYTLPRQCKKCQWLFACNGECPRNRFCTSADGETGLNYLCRGYSMFFSHVAPYMDFMKAKLDQGEAPADIMQAIGDNAW